MKKIIKISSPFNLKKYQEQIDPLLLEKYSFELDNDCEECDYWIVWGDLPSGLTQLRVNCPVSNIYYIPDEAYVEKKFNQNFLNQFAGVITCRLDIAHANLILTHEINVWQLKKSFSELYNDKPIEKTEKISVVCSDKTFLEGHKKRFALVNRLIGHFKDRLHVYGKGFNPIEDKWEALSKYEYSVAIENSSLPGYFTEKIAECFLAHTFPIYYGAPDIYNFFDKKSYALIDINDYKSCIRVIESLLDENSYDAHRPLLIDQKFRYMSRYHFFSALSRIIDSISATSRFAKRRKVLIKSHESFEKGYKLKKIVSVVKKVI